MPKSKRGASPNTRKSVQASNLRRKVDRIRNELGTIAREESDRLLAQSPKAIAILFLLQEYAEKDDRASELAKELQLLLVEQAHQDAIVDGTSTYPCSKAIELPGGSWIV